MKRDYYDVLELAKSASTEEIKKAYRRLAVKYHPDHNPENNSAEEKFKEVSEAYETLSDSRKKSHYDAHGDPGAEKHTAPHGWNPFQGAGNPFDSGIFEQFFGGRGRSVHHQGRRGGDIAIRLEISFLEAAHGTSKTIILERNINCKTCAGLGGTGEAQCHQCSGSGTIAYRHGSLIMQTTCNSCLGGGKTVAEVCSVCHGNKRDLVRDTVTVEAPIGIATGDRLRLPGVGHESYGGSGDLFVEIAVQTHPIFSRDANDIHSVIDLSVSEAALGCRRVVQTIHGEKTVTVPAGSQPNSFLRLRGCGIKDSHALSAGDHQIQVGVVIPTNMSDEQVEIFEQLKKTEEEKIR